MKWLQRLNALLEKVFETISGLLVIAIMAIICLQVVARNLFSFNLGSLADYPVYLMIYAVWIGAIVAAKNDNHLSIDLVSTVTKSRRIQLTIKILMDLITAAAFGIFAFYGAKQLGVLYKRNQIEAATKLPMWLLESIMPFSAAFQSFYYVVNVVKKARRLMEK